MTPETNTETSAKLPSMAGSWARIRNTDEWGASLPADCYSPGDIVTLQRKDGTEKDVRLVERVTGGVSDRGPWSVWRITLDLSAPPARRAAAQPVVRRRKGEAQVLRAVVTPDPPPHTDADAPPPPSLQGEEPGRDEDDEEAKREFIRECREDERAFHD